MMMAVDIYPESHAYAGLPYLSARTKNDQVWGDMTIWWEATDKGFRNLTYGCYLKFDPNAKTYAVAMYEDPDGEDVPRAYSEAEATPIGFVSAQDPTYKVLCGLKDKYGGGNIDFSNSTSWYLGEIHYQDIVQYQTRKRDGWVYKYTDHEYIYVVYEYYRPQYNTTTKTWVAGTNVNERTLSKSDVLNRENIINGLIELRNEEDKLKAILNKYPNK